MRFLFSLLAIAALITPPHVRAQTDATFSSNAVVASGSSQTNAAQPTGAGPAQSQPFRIDKSLSPDGMVEMWVKPQNVEGIAAGLVQIREAKTGKIQSTFEWSGFGDHLEAPDPPFDVFWRGDSKYFAIKYEESRGWVTGAIYGRSSNGKWSEVKMPSDEYETAIKKMGKVTDLYGKGCDCPTAWNANGNLELLFVDRSLAYDGEDLEKEFVVTLKVEDEKGEPLKTAKVVTTREKTEDEVEKDLRKRLSL